MHRRLKPGRTCVVLPALAVRFRCASLKSFASVSVYPVVDVRIDVDIDESDCGVDSLRASGAGPCQTSDRSYCFPLQPQDIDYYVVAVPSQHNLIVALKGK